MVLTLAPVLLPLLLVLERRKPKLAEEFTLPVALSVVAGGSPMGAVLVFRAHGGSILNKLLGGLTVHGSGFVTPRVAADTAMTHPN